MIRIAHSSSVCYFRPAHDLLFAVLPNKTEPVNSGMQGCATPLALWCVCDHFGSSSDRGRFGKKVVCPSRSRESYVPSSFASQLLLRHWPSSLTAVQLTVGAGCVFPVVVTQVTHHESHNAPEPSLAVAVPYVCYVRLALDTERL